MRVVVLGRKADEAGNNGCPFCDKIMNILEEEGIECEYIDINTNADLYKVTKLAYGTVPQLFLDGKHIGDSQSLPKLLACLEESEEDFEL